MFENFVNRLNEKKKVIIPSILVLVLIIGGAVYGVNHNKPIEKKPAKKAVHKVKEDKSAEASSEPAANESTTSKSATNKSDKPVENSKPSKAEKNSSAKSGSVAASSGSSSSTQASKPKEPIYGTRTVQKAVQVYDPMKESYIQCACGCRNPSGEHTSAHLRAGEPSGTKRVYVGGYVTKYETVTERYIIGYK